MPDVREPDAHRRQCDQLRQHRGRRHLYPAKCSGKRELHRRDPGGQMAAPVQRDSWRQPADRAATEHAGEPHSRQHTHDRHCYRISRWRRVRAARYGHLRLGVYRRQPDGECRRLHSSLRGKFVARGEDYFVDSLGNCVDDNEPERHHDATSERVRHGDVSMPGNPQQSGNHHRRHQSSELRGSRRPHFCHALQLRVVGAGVALQRAVRERCQLDERNKYQLNRGNRAGEL